MIHRESLIKIASGAIGLCSSVKPEKQAEAAIDAILERYNVAEREIKQND